MKRSNNTLLTAALICGTALVVALPAQAATVTKYLSAEAFTKTLPALDALGAPTTKDVLMWGYREYTDNNFTAPVGPASSPGPAIALGTNDTTLVIVLKNNLVPDVNNPSLDVATSIVIPGQNGFVRDGTHASFTDAQGRVRARSFVKEATPGNVVIYQWNNVTPGTYLYHSGSHAALQVQMGLFGALTRTVDDAVTPAIEVYPPKLAGGAPVAVAGEVTLLVSEIDTKVHDAVATSAYAPGKAMSSTIHSVPDYFLVNGEVYQGQDPQVVGSAGQTLLVRFLNAGYNERVPVLNGYHLTFIAEDGRLSPGPRQQVAPLLPALKTMDALWTPAAGEVVFYDRRLGLVNGAQIGYGGMIKKLLVN